MIVKTGCGTNGALHSTSCDITLAVVGDDPPLRGHGRVVTLREVRGARAQVLVAAAARVGAAVARGGGVAAGHQVRARPLEDVGAVRALLLLLGPLLRTPAEVEAERRDGGLGRLLAAQLAQELRARQRAQGVRGLGRPLAI